MGHPIGDELLSQIGQRLASRGSSEGDFAARLGGDEFAVLCHDIPDVETALELANRISNSLAGPVVLQGVSLHVEASVGVALSPLHAKDVDVLLQRADVALYQAKENGPGSIVLYDSSYDDNSIERLTLMEQFRSGIEHELVLYYQPKCRLSDGEIVGVEALAAGSTRRFGLLPPTHFLIAAENTGLMMPLTLQVMRQALAQWRDWQKDGLDLSVSVNVSARNIPGRAGKPESKSCSTSSTMPGESLLLEVTESSVVANTRSATNVIQELRAMGVGISIDDFGTGHSSLASSRTCRLTEVEDRPVLRDGRPRPARMTPRWYGRLSSSVAVSGCRSSPKVSRRPKSFASCRCRLRPRPGIPDPAARSRRTRWWLGPASARLGRWNLRTQMANRVEPEAVRVLIIVYACLVVLALEAVVLRGGSHD